MTVLMDSTGSLKPWYKRRASVHTISVRSMLLLSSLVLMTLSLALFIIVDATVPATLDMSFFNVKAPYISFNSAPQQSGAATSATQLPICFRGNSFNTTAVLNLFFDSPDIPIGYIASVTPAAAVLHPLTTALVLLVLVTAALPCFVPPVVAVALSWFAAASSVAAVGCTFSLAMAIRPRLVGDSSYVFEYGIGIWALLVSAISVWVFTALLTIWWLRHRSDRKRCGESTGESGSAHYLPNGNVSLEFQIGEFPGEKEELPEGKNSHRHGLFDTDTRGQGRVELGAKDRYELGTPERSKLSN
ncbi:hypothetical protein NUW58_g8663 [Xylaria curta]|uniref:Uncharacterized protein n=1 Tax=Xylaria curta TaxID=42375 RepID=A0ACC1N7K9_9PEZI|nr:hypothetical protein NUW58_g8663 [Xylaria curta]